MLSRGDDTYVPRHADDRILFTVRRSMINSRSRSVAAVTLTAALLLSSLPAVSAAPRAGAARRSHAKAGVGQAAGATRTSGGLGVPTSAGTPPPAQPTPVIAGLGSAPAHGYLDRQGRFHSALVPYSVHSHWFPSQVGGPARPNDRFTAAAAPLRYIDVLTEPNHRKVDTAHLQSALWSFLRDMSMRPVVLGRVRVLGAWLPIIGVTNLSTGQPQAEIVFATPQNLWMVNLTTMAGMWPRDVHELTYMAGTFRLECMPLPCARVADNRR